MDTPPGKNAHDDRRSSPISAGRAARQTFSRRANWSIGLIAALLVLISAGGYFHHRRQLAELATEHLRLIVTGPSTIHVGSAAEYTVSATTIDGRALPAEIEVALLDPDGERIRAFRESTDDKGLLKIVIPPDEQLPEYIELKVAAEHNDNRDEAEIELAVLPEPFDARLSLDRSRYRPGDTIHFRSVSLSRFGLEEPPAGKVRFEAIGPFEMPMPGSASEVELQRGVAGGTYSIPAETAKEQYILNVHGADVYSSDSEDFIVSGEEKSKPLIDSPDEPKTSEPPAKRTPSLVIDSEEFDAGEPLEIKVKSFEVGRPLVVAVYFKGAQVGQQPFYSTAYEAAGQPVQIDLDKSLGGVIRVALYDYGATPPELLDERIVYRRPSRKLNVHISGAERKYAPGETVELSLLLSDETDNPVPAALGVEVEKIDGSHKPTASAEDSRTKRERLQRFDDRPPMMFDNLGGIKEDYENSLAAYQSGHTGLLTALPAASFFGGLALMFLVVFLGLMRLVWGVNLLVSAVAAVTCCAILGAILLDPVEPMIGPCPTQAYAPYIVPVNEAGRRLELCPSPDVSNNEPETVFYQPLLIADREGRATVQFKLPEMPGTYIVTIDAHGDGRIGVGRAEIVVQPVAENDSDESKTGK